MCYIYKFWWNSVSKYIGLYLAITSYSTRFNISHSLLSHDHYIKQNIRHKLTSGLYCKWYALERTSGSMEARWTPHIHSLMVMPISLTVCQWNKLQNKQAYIFFARDLYQKRKRFGLLMKDGLSKTVPWNICSRRRKESVFLGHLKKRNIYTFYKVSTDRFHTRGQQLWFFLFWSKRRFYKRKEFNPQGTFLIHQYGRRFLIVVYTNVAAMRSMWKRSI